MSLLWVRPAHLEARLVPEERRVREYLDTRAGVSESVASLATKLGLDRGLCRRVLERLAGEGVVHRREFDDIEPLYTRFPTL